MLPYKPSAHSLLTGRFWLSHPRCYTLILQAFQEEGTALLKLWEEKSGFKSAALQVE